MEKQPNSRMCFVCGIDNPMGLVLASYTDDWGRCIACFHPITGAPGLSRAPAWGDHQHPTGRPNSNSNAL